MIRLSRRGILAAAAWLPAAAQAEELLGPDALEPTPGPLPEVRFETADGAARSLADYAGRPVLLNLWATWCLPCVAEMPALDRLAGMADWLAVLPLSSDRGGAAQVERFYARAGIAHLPVLLDPRGETARRLGARGIPTSLVVHPNGQARARLEGAAAWDTPEMASWFDQNLRP